jgi:serine/threonine-protein kinase
VVGYSRLLVNEQIELMQELNQLVRSTESFRSAETSGKLIRLPTGDGMALLFFRNPEEPVRCALEISQALKSRPHIQLRMGVHSGPVNTVTDVNDRTNVAGSGINIAQRVMDCADAGHILVSKHLADDLAEYRHWRPYLHDLGECEVKHGFRLHIVNLYKDGLGNPASPEKLKRGKRWKQKSGAAVRPITAPRWPKFALVIALFLSAVAVAISFLRSTSWIRPGSASSAAIAMPIPAKSIAVLPFNNFSDEKQNAHLAEGVQDEILTDLAKVADLKVISRTSVMQYKSGADRNLREIAKQLGVAHILEGSVQCINGRIRVTAQLIDATTDTHVWADRYDRVIADVFAVESELAETIVAQLKSKLSPEEKASIEARPTADLVAYDSYVRAKNLISNAVFNAPRAENLSEAVRLLDEAVKRDPEFFLAYYELAHAHDQFYSTGEDHTAARLALAESAIQALVRLHPDSGETHLALAKHFYWGHLDYDRARTELSAALRALPNDPLPLLLIGYIDRRQGRWEESLKNMERAMDLDPRNVFILRQISLSHECLRRYPDLVASLDRALTLAPKDDALRVQRAAVDLEWRADSKPLHSAIQAIVAQGQQSITSPIADQWIYLALCERDQEAAGRGLAALGPDGCRNDGLFPRAWCEALVARQRGEVTAARMAFTKARAETEKIVREQPNYAEALSALGMIDAALGNTENAIREGRRAVELLPINKDSIVGAQLIQNLAIIYAWVGKKDLACKQLDLAIKLPGYLSYGSLRLHPHWDPLRGDPKFDKIVASLAPK